jgi:hypothetical protein
MRGSGLGARAVNLRRNRPLIGTNEHRQVLISLRAARARYDQATTRAALLKLQDDWPQTSAAIRQCIEQLDHWGNNSNLLGDYAALLQTFASA